YFRQQSPPPREPARFGRRQRQREVDARPPRRPPARYPRRQLASRPPRPPRRPAGTPGRQHGGVRDLSHFRATQPETPTGTITFVHVEAVAIDQAARESTRGDYSTPMIRAIMAMGPV